MTTHKYSTKPSKELVAGQFAHDNRVNQAKQILQSTLNEYQQKITEIRPPIESLKITYDEMLNSLTQCRGGKLWFPYIGSGLGNGPLVELADGSIKYDFISGIGVHFFGHNHPDLLDANIDAAISNTVMQGHLMQNLDTLELSKLLVHASKLDHCFITTSGAMANENAFKIAFQKQFPANRILAFNRCFLGRTLTCSQITDKPSFREGLPLNTPVDYIPFYDDADRKGSTERAVNALNAYIKRYPNQHAIMCFELVQGEGGFYVGSHHFFSTLMTILKNHQITVFVDEVQTFGRTQELFAFQYFELQPFVDIVTIGKLSQVCATLFTENYKPRPGLLSQTFTSSTSAIKSAIIILNKLINEGYYGLNGKNTVLHCYFVKLLKDLAERYPKYIEGPFGIGSMIAFTPFEGNPEKVTRFVHRLFSAGVISFVAGGAPYPMRVRFLIPTGAITYHDLDKVFAIIEKTLIEEGKS